jgi:hypothetical protein
MSELVEASEIRLLVFDQTYLFEEVFVKYFAHFFKLMFVGLNFCLYSFFQPLISQLNKFFHTKALKL